MNLKMTGLCLIPVFVAVLLSGCSDSSPTAASFTSPSSTAAEPTASLDDPVLGSTLEKWTKKYGQPQGKNLTRLMQDYIILKFYNRPEAYDIFLQFAYLDQKRRTSTEADSIVKQFLPKDAVIVARGKKELSSQELFFDQIDTYDSPSLSTLFGEGSIEVRKKVWTTADPKPGISDIQIAYITQTEAELIANFKKHQEELAKQDNNQSGTKQKNASPEQENAKQLINSLVKANRERLKQHRDFLEQTNQTITEQYKAQKASPDKKEWNAFVETIHDEISQQRDEFISIYVDIRAIPKEYVKFTLSISELFAKLDGDLILVLSDDLDGKKNQLPKVKKEIRALFETIEDDDL